MPRIADADTGSETERYRHALQIDKHDLDNALITQPDMFYRVASNLAQAISRRDELKLDLGNAVAELDRQVRESAGEKKPTEKAIESEINGMPRIITLRKDFARLCGEVEQWSALKEAFQDRSQMLRKLVDLYVSNYYAGQTNRAPIADARDRRAEDVREASGRERRAR